MIVTLQPDDLLYPKGVLPMSIFPDSTPGKTAHDALTAWIEEADAILTTAGVAQPLTNLAARHYCYAKAYRSEALRLLATPNTTSDSGNPMSVAKGWGADRWRGWLALAEEEEVIFSSLSGIEVQKPRVPISLFEVV